VWPPREAAQDIACPTRSLGEGHNLTTGRRRRTRPADPDGGLDREESLSHLEHAVAG